jgi:hypothetical protein
MLFAGSCEINPNCVAEYFVQALMMLCGSCVWAYVIGSCCGILATLNPAVIEYRQTMDEARPPIERSSVACAVARTVACSMRARPAQRLCERPRLAPGSHRPAQIVLSHGPRNARPRAACSAQQCTLTAERCLGCRYFRNTMHLIRTRRYEVLLGKMSKRCARSPTARLC